MSQDLNIAYVINQYPRGSHTFIRREIQALEAQGTHVDRISLRRTREELIDPADRAELTRTRVVLDGGMPVLTRHLMRTARRRPLAWAQALRLALRIGRCSDRGPARHVAYLAEACVLVDWCRARGTQHIHAHFGTNSAAVVMLCRVLGGPPYSFTVHGPEEFDKAPLLALGDKIAHAAFVVAVCDYGRSQLYRQTTIDQWHKIHVVRCGLDRELPAQPYVPVPTAPRLACVARLDEAKGQLVLLEAAAQLVAGGEHFELVLLGDGPLRPVIERRIQELKLEHTVKLLGWVDGVTVRRQVQASRAMVLPSFAEGLPTAIVETLALHRPVITTHIAGIPELIEPGVHGWLAPAGAVAPLATAMQAALHAEPDALARMGHAGAQRVAQLHDATLAAAQLRALFAAGAGPK